MVVVSMLSPLFSGDYRWIAERLGEALGQSVDYFEEADWRERQAMLLAGQAQIGFLCSLPYVRESHRLQLLAAPVMRAARYGDQPIYFSDVVVRSASPYRSFADLAGARFAYNEPGSQSGYNIVRYQLARLGQSERYFGEVVESGAHAESLKLILAGSVDASAIDSAVWERELQRHPELASRLRVVATLGPSPIQPIVASAVLPASVRTRVQDILLSLVFPPDSPFRRLARVSDSDYEVIREMDAAAAHIAL